MAASHIPPVIRAAHIPHVLALPQQVLLFRLLNPCKRPEFLRHFASALGLFPPGLTGRILNPHYLTDDESVVKKLRKLIPERLDQLRITALREAMVIHNSWRTRVRASSAESSPGAPGGSPTPSSRDEVNPCASAPSCPPDSPPPATTHSFSPAPPATPLGATPTCLLPRSADPERKRRKLVQPQRPKQSLHKAAAPGSLVDGSGCSYALPIVDLAQSTSPHDLSLLYPARESN
jgi:hypothetical protein